MSSTELVLSEVHVDKVCRVCQVHKSLSEYGTCRAMKDGHQTGCKACAKIHRLKNLDHIHKKNKEWYTTNHTKVLRRAKEYVKNNKELHKARCRSWGLRNRDKTVVFVAEYRARKFNAIPESTDMTDMSILKSLYIIAKGLSRINNIKYEVDHRKPLVKGGKHHWMNLQIVTEKVNRQKGAKYESRVN